MRTLDIIRKKREGLALTREEIAAFVAAYMRGEVPEDEAAAWLAAIQWRGLDKRETVNLSEAMAPFGHDYLSGFLSPRIGQHSTGGVGDKTSLVVAPVSGWRVITSQACAPAVESEDTESR